jgi:hypothetical protein
MEAIEHITQHRMKSWLKNVILSDFNSFGALKNVLNAGQSDFFTLYNQARKNLAQSLIEQLPTAEQNTLSSIVDWSMTKTEVQTVAKVIHDIPEALDIFKSFSSEDCADIIRIMMKFKPLKNFPNGQKNSIKETLGIFKKYSPIERRKVLERLKAWELFPSDGISNYYILSTLKQVPLLTNIPLKEGIELKNLDHRLKNTFFNRQRGDFLALKFRGLLKAMKNETIPIMIHIAQDHLGKGNIVDDQVAELVFSLAALQEDDYLEMYHLIKQIQEEEKEAKTSLSSNLALFFDLTLNQAKNLIHLARKEAVLTSPIGAAIEKGQGKDKLYERLELLKPLSKLSIEDARYLVREVRNSTKETHPYWLGVLYNLADSIPVQRLRDLFDTFKNVESIYSIKENIMKAQAIIKDLSFDQSNKVITLVKQIIQLDQHQGKTASYSGTDNLSYFQEMILFKDFEINEASEVAKIFHKKIIDNEERKKTYTKLFTYPVDQTVLITQFLDSLPDNIICFSLSTVWTELDAMTHDERPGLLSAYLMVPEPIRGNFPVPFQHHYMDNTFMILRGLGDPEARRAVIDEVNRAAPQTAESVDSYLRRLESRITKEKNKFNPNDFFPAYTAQPIYLDPEHIRAAKGLSLPEAPEKPGTEVIKDFDKLMGNFDLKDDQSENYLSYEQITGAPLQGNQNNEVEVKKLFKRSKGFLKALYDIPLGHDEEKGWQTYDEVKPFMRNAVQAILTKLLEADDEDTRTMNMSVFMNGLLYCPTGQKEGIDTVVSALFSDRASVASSLEEQVRSLVAEFKGKTLDTILTFANNPQNVHIRSYYKGELAEALGLGTAMGNFEEILYHGLNQPNEPFQSKPINALKKFFGQFNPDTLTKYLLDHVQNEADYQRQNKMFLIQKRLQKLKADKTPLKTSPQEMIDILERSLKANQEELANAQKEVNQEDIDYFKGQVEQTESRLTSLRRTKPNSKR